MPLYFFKLSVHNGPFGFIWYGTCNCTMKLYSITEEELCNEEDRVCLMSCS